ncbi:hypothetical protein C8T65DRAFT_730903 [Cerioporus squamosus]|nr:hypothetical protein C8T65DRAFT_730903 [Cerioporus squamosus]
MVWPRDVATSLNISNAALGNLSQTIDATYEEVQLALWNEGYNLKQSFITVALLTMFFGLFTVLAAVAAYVLLSKRIEPRRAASMLMAIVVMWVSTLAYWVADIVATVEAYTVLRDLTLHISDLTTNMRDCLGSLPVSDSTFSCTRGGPLTERPGPTAYGLQACTGTAALTINVTIGDSIVWWRALVLWPDNRVVRWLCVMMILLTSVTGVLDTVVVCVRVAQEDDWATPGSVFKLPDGDQIIEGSMFSGSAYGVLAGLSSLLTNIAATSLIAYRAWEHRRIIMSHLKGFSPRTQVERTLALLVESGLLYCAIWVLMVVCEVIHLPLGAEESAFADRFRYVMNGCLVPMIGMYPTLMIIVCALDRSLYEKSVDEHARNPSLGLDMASIRPCGTLSELLSQSSAFTATKRTAGGSRPSKDDAGGAGKTESLSYTPAARTMDMTLQHEKVEVGRRSLTSALDVVGPLEVVGPVYEYFQDEDSCKMG